MNTRALAALVVSDVIANGVSLTDALEKHQKKLKSHKDQALLQELCFGVCRWWWRFDAVLAELLDKPLKQKDSDLKCLIMVGFYQLSFLRVPDHAAVAETVNACADLNKTWARKLLNALLRNYQRKQKTLHDALQSNLQYQYSHPQWLLEAITRAWPDDWQQIANANNQKPPMVLRVNKRKSERKKYLDLLKTTGTNATEFTFNDVGLILKKPAPVDLLPRFKEGWVSVQDGAAQLAAGLLKLADARRVLDVCAAPGGKASHILEAANDDTQLTALDIDADRLAKVTDNLHRLGLSATTIKGDAQHPEDWWDQQSFDRILIDAPCSATGVIRRHPDIKHLRRPSDIQNLTKLQETILDAVWPLLSSGGMLLYATCSILPEENSMQISKFIERHADASLMEIESDWGVEQAWGRQIFPGHDEMDGFYYACLQKQ